MAEKFTKEQAAEIKELIAEAIEELKGEIDTLVAKALEAAVKARAAGTDAAEVKRQDEHGRKDGCQQGLNTMAIAKGRHACSRGFTLPKDCKGTACAFFRKKAVVHPPAEVKK
jgi:hypothetical protein